MNLHGQTPYRDLRRDAAQLLALARAVAARGGAPLLTAADPAYTDLFDRLNAAIRDHCAWCGRRLITGLLGPIGAATTDGIICPVCYDALPFADSAHEAATAQLRLIAMTSPGTVASLLGPTLMRGATERLTAELSLDLIGLTRLALCPAPRPTHLAQDITRIAAVAGCPAEPLIRLLAPLVTPAPPAGGGPAY